MSSAMIILIGGILSCGGLGLIYIEIQTMPMRAEVSERLMRIRAIEQNTAQTVERTEKIKQETEKIRQQTEAISRGASCPSL